MGDLCKSSFVGKAPYELGFPESASYFDPSPCIRARRIPTAALPEDTQNDIYRVILTGEAAPVDLPALQAALAPRFYAVAVRDETRPRKDLWQDAADDTLRGLFLQALKAQYDAAPDDAARRTIALAARLGTAAMDGREMDA